MRTNKEYERIKKTLKRRSDPRDVNESADHEGIRKISERVAKAAVCADVNINLEELRQYLNVCGVNIEQKCTDLSSGLG